MEKFNGIRYNSRWDSSTWLIIAITMVCCVIPCFLDDGIGPIIICPMMLVFIIVTFRSVYYKIDGDRLVVYQFFIPTAYPHRQNQGNTKDKKYPFSPSHIPYQPAGGDIHRKEGTEKLNASDNLPGAQRGVHQPHSFNQSRHHGKSRQQDIIRLNSDTTTADTHTQQSRQISPRRQMDDRESGAEFFTCIFTGTSRLFHLRQKIETYLPLPGSFRIG